VYGFGPRGGYVFQKSFVEFFVKESVVDELEKRADKEGGLVTFYAGNRKVRRASLTRREFRQKPAADSCHLGF
jgi:hypothetical protein